MPYCKRLSNFGERPVDPALESETLLELLVQWEELRKQGKTATPEELCPDDERLQGLLRERLARRKRLQAALDFPTPTQPAEGNRGTSLPVIDGYEIGELLGRGGMGLVFRARQKVLKRDVALKIIVSGAHAGDAERARFRTEAEAVARLHHPGIVQIYEVGEQAGCPYLALELVNGGSLAEHLNGAPMPPRQAAQLLLDLARAVQHAHEQGIVHRDLKPSNVLLAAWDPANGDTQPQASRSKITDFGLAKLLDVESGQTQTGAVIGSPSYMSPEQAAGHARAIGPATDIYALGAILYELLTGRPPFLGASILETLEQVRVHDPAPPQTLQPGVSEDLASICLKCLEKNPADRYPSAAALADDLDCFLRGERIAARKMTLWDQAARLIRCSQLDFNWGAWATMTLGLAPVPLLAHVAVFVFFHNRSEYPPVAISVSLVTVVAMLCSIFFGKRASMRVVAPAQRRQLMSTWLGHIIGLVLTPLVILRMMHPATSEQWFVIYAVWLSLAGCSFFSLAANAGFFYLTGSLCFLLAIITPLVPFYMPLVVGSLMSLNMFTLGLILRRVARQAAADRMTGPGPAKSAHLTR
jgi:serine/threonine protein kinase